ncbi:MAG: serine--tRNA ligase [Clostridia bacterium]|nr:serine--tRNA ligase [Clostridia bacterium]
MLDINAIRQNPEEIKAKLAKKGCNVDFTEFLQLDAERRQLLQEVESLKALRNKVSSQIPVLKKNGEDVSAVLEEMKVTSDKIKEMDDQVKVVDQKIFDFVSYLPNIPADDVIAGGKENNEMLRVWGSKPEFDFPAKDHVELAKNLGLIDYERGAKLSGNGFWMYRGKGALLEWALLNYFIETHMKDGYEFILPPHMLGARCGFTAGQFPKFADEVYYVGERNGDDSDKFLLPTAETALINMYRDEVLDEATLPQKLFAYTPCFRKEAGSYRSDERGMIRGHQFDKVEMFQYTTPETSDDALMELVGKAEALLQGLGLHYQLSKLAAEDCSASMMKTYDIEVWIPSMGIYKEVSSCSNAGEYQARRGNIRFKRKATGKNEYIHSLNGSGLATSRVIPALLEQYQQADGSVIVPEVLRKWMGCDVLR